MKREFQIFLTAIMFYTRIPVPRWVDHSQEYLNESTRYFPLMGWIVGGWAAMAFYAAHFVFPLTVSVLLSMIASILITGAFHEDGFADMCDGFGSGWDKMQVLEIMKDSRIGTYGALGLMLMVVLKFIVLCAIPAVYIPVLLIIAHTVSRWMILLYRVNHHYVRENEDSKAKPMAQHISRASVVVGSLFGILPLFLLNTWIVFLLLIPVFVMQWYIGRYFVRRIGGYTGDCLGAMQQLCEVAFYLSFIALWKFI